MKKTMKRILAMLMVVVMTVGAASLSGFVGLELPDMPEFTALKKLASSVSDFFDGFATKAAAATSGTCGENLTWVFDESTGTLTINGAGEMTNYSDVSLLPWDSYRSKIKSVIIGNNVTSIGEYTVYYCLSLTSVIIGSSVTKIAKNTFHLCDNITCITVDSANMTYSNDEYGVLFNKDRTELIRYPAGNTRLSYIIPNSVKNINEYSFYKCCYLTNITIPNSVTSIGNAAFYSCGSLTSAIIPDSVTSIGYSVFCYCGSLTSVTIPDSVTNIGNSLFFSCHKLTSATIGNGVTSIGQNAFGACYNLTSITIPDGVTSIGDRAFESCSSLTSVIIPDSVTNIGNSAFYSCDSLTIVIIPDSVTSIGNSAFYSCDRLTSVIIPGSITNIGQSVFSNCRSLTSVIIGNGLTNMGERTFQYCSNLTTITIPDSVTRIGSNMFYNCTSLNDIYYTGSEAEWNEILIDSPNTPLLNATIHFNSAVSSDAIEYNDHYYKVIDMNMSWKEAKAYCESLGGHLITITSKEEDDFVFGIINELFVGDCWFGATDEKVEGTWEWVTGEKFEYTNWDSCQPDNDYDGTEDYLGSYYGSAWNDFRNDDLDVEKWFICEWDNTSSNDPDTPGGETPEPEPAYGFTFENGYEKVTVGSTFALSADFVSETCEPNSDNISYSITGNEGGLVANGFMSFLGTKESGIVSLPLLAVKAGTYTVTFTCVDSSSASCEIKIAKPDSNGTYYGKLESSVISAVIDGNDSWISEITVDGVAYDVNKNFSQENNLFAVVDGYEGKNVVLVVSDDNEVIWLQKAEDIKTQIYASVSFDNNELTYRDKKYSADKIKAEVIVYSKYFPGFPGDVNVLYGIPELETTLKKVELQSENPDLFNFDGNETKILVGSDKNIAFGNSMKFECYIDVDDSYRIPKKQMNEVVKINCNIDSVQHGASSSASSGSLVNILNLNNTKPAEEPSETDDAVVKAAASELEKAIESGTFTMNYYEIEEIFNQHQLRAIGARLLASVVMSSAPKETFAEQLSEKVIEKVFNFKTSWFESVLGIENGKTAFTVATTTEYGEIQVKFSCNYSNYYLNKKRVGFTGNILYEITGGKGYDDLPSAIKKSGMIGSLVGKDISAFCDAAYEVAEKELKEAYNIFDGTTANKAADLIFGESVNKILKKTKYGSVSGMFWESIITPAKMVKIECPVDVYVYNSENKLVAAVENNKVVLTDENAGISVDGDTKTVWLYDDSYTIVYRSLAKYDMTVTVEEYGSSDTLLKRSVIENIPLEIGKTFTQNIDYEYLENSDYSIASSDGETITVTDETSMLHEHINSTGWEVVKASDCVNEGYKTANCSICNEWYNEFITATGHTAGEWETVTESTCTTIGEKVKKCENCDEILGTEEIPTSGHIQGSWVTSIAPSCTEAGEKIAHCTVCNVIVANDIIPATGHVQGSWIVTKEATCTAEGERIRRCLYCSEVMETEKTPITDHTPGNWVTVLEPSTDTEGKKVKKCTVCGVTLEEISIPVVEDEISVWIAAPSTTTISYGDSIILHAESDGVLSKGYSYSWMCSDGNFAVESNGDTCKITPITSGNSTITLILSNENGSPVATDTQTMTSKAGLFDKIIAFFKKIFGLTKTIPQVFKGTL